MRVNSEKWTIISLATIFLGSLTIQPQVVAASSAFLAVPQHHNHSVSMSNHGEGPVTDCSELHVQFDHQEAEVRSEEKTISRSEATVLRVNGGGNGGVQVQGWDKDNYSVKLCKAVAPGGDAETIFSQISLNVSNGEVSVKGPADHEGWTAYLLIRSPRGAVIEANTTNGPLGFYGVDGKVHAKAVNGPIELSGVSGDIEVSATNGPISVHNSSGNVRIRTQNGPISVALEGNTWNGAGLQADAENGPLTLHVPGGFQSSFLVESKGYSPVTCRASICDQARKTWDDDHKRIEYGSGPAVIRLSTVNGPVAVQ
jgi:hypothetical protein